MKRPDGAAPVEPQPFWYPLVAERALCSAPLNCVVPLAFTIYPTQVCHKFAVRFETMRAKSRLFNTSAKGFRAGLVVGKLLKRMVSAEGIEPSTY